MIRTSITKTYMAPLCARTENPKLAFRRCRRSQASVIASSASSQNDDIPPSQASIKDRLAAYGLSGVASYGLFNTLYYFTSFFVVLITLPKPSGIDTFTVALRHVLKLLALVWAGSQVSKLPRAACALACAPLMDRLLERIQSGFRLKGKREAFLYVLVPFCWSLFFALLGISVLFLRYKTAS